MTSLNVIKKAVVSISMPIAKASLPMAKTVVNYAAASRLGKARGFTTLIGMSMCMPISSSLVALAGISYLTGIAAKGALHVLNPTMVLLHSSTDWSSIDVEGFRAPTEEAKFLAIDPSLREGLGQKGLDAVSFGAWNQKAYRDMVIAKSPVDAAVLTRSMAVPYRACNDVAMTNAVVVHPLMGMRSFGFGLEATVNRDYVNSNLCTAETSSRDLSARSPIWALVCAGLYTISSSDTLAKTVAALKFKAL